MIPQFPVFKDLEFTDKDEIEAYSLKYPPYSDFNFTSMWAWNCKEEMKVSILNDNLIVKFTDYITQNPFYSFLGTNKIKDTVEKLLKFSISEGIGGQISLIPEEAINEIDLDKYIVTESRDHFDYLIPVTTLTEYNTKSTRSRRKSVNQFLREYKPRTEILDFTNVKNLYALKELLKIPTEISNILFNHDIYALMRSIVYLEGLNCTPIGIFIDSKMVGFCLVEKLNDTHGIGHFLKADVTVSTGVYSYLLQQSAIELARQGCEYLNFEQDLGIENLRKWKMSYGSDKFLKKFSVTIK